MSQVDVLAACRGCEGSIPALEGLVRRRVSHPRGVVLIVSCPWCDALNSVFVSREEWERRAALASSPVRERERVGVLVKGFAVDLEAVNFLEDITMFWDYQEVREPGSVVSEDEIWRNR